MAGNDSDARRRREVELKTAEKGGNKKDINAAKAALNTATNKENAATGSSGQARSFF